MRSLHIFRFLLFSLILGLPSASQAMLIAVYTQPGDSLPLEEVAALAAALRQNPDFTSGDKFAVRIADSSVLSADYSVPPGVSAYFWSDRTYEHRGFQMLGAHAYFLSEHPVEASAAEDTVAQATDVAPVIAWVTAFQGASMDSKHLQLRYTLSEPGRVSLEVYGMNGRNYGRWNWEEASSGQYQRSVELNRAPGGATLVRWSCGNIQVIRRISGSDKGSR